VNRQDKIICVCGGALLVGGLVGVAYVAGLPFALFQGAVYLALILYTARRCW
jgi:hypothetical protein